MASQKFNTIAAAGGSPEKVITILITNATPPIGAPSTSVT